MGLASVPVSETLSHHIRMYGVRSLGCMNPNGWGPEESQQSTEEGDRAGTDPTQLRGVRRGFLKEVGSLRLELSFQKAQMLEVFSLVTSVHSAFLP